MLGIEDILSGGFKVKEFKNLSFFTWVRHNILLYLQLDSIYEKEY